MKLERISFTLDDLLLRADTLMLSATKQALAVPCPEKIHRLQRTKRHTQHAAHVASRDKKSTTKRRKGASDAA